MSTTEQVVAFELASRLASGTGIEQNTPAAAAMYERLARSGHIVSQLYVAQYYLRNTQDAEKNALAVKYLENAAAAGLAPAQGELSVLYLRGRIVTQDTARAAQLARMAAAKNSPTGQNALGMMLAEGQGVDRDIPAAIDMYNKALAQGLTSALINLAQAYRDADAPLNDNVVAHALFSVSIAAVRNEADRAYAAQQRDQLGIVMLPSDISLAYRIAGDWKPGADIVALRRAAAPPANPITTSPPLFTAVAAKPKPLPNTPAATIVQQFARSDSEVDLIGNQITTSEIGIKALDEAAAQKIGQQALYFKSNRGTMEVLEAYTQKPNGRRIAVQKSAIHTQMPPSRRDVAMFDDTRQMTILFPDVHAGDVVVYKTRSTSTPVVRGAFTYAHYMNLGAAQEEASYRLTVPTAMKIKVDSRSLPYSERQEGDKTVYQWSYTNPQPVSFEQLTMPPEDLWPRIAFSSFADHVEFARAYARLVEPKMQVTPAIQKQADEITAGVSDRRRQAELIYDWVSRQVRYVAVAVGEGDYVPHDAGSVLANHYGDCKDHSVLFSALLRAKGIDSTFVLINASDSASITTVPTLSSFDHAIVWLPEFEMYADTTVGVAPFGVLTFTEYGKPVIHASTSAPALRRTPALPPDSATITLKTTAKLDGDGRISGTSETVAGGPYAIALRQMAIAIQQNNPDGAARQIMQNNGLDGSGTFDLGSPFTVTPGYRVSAEFQTNRRSDLVSGNGFRLPTPLALGWRPGENLIGPIDGAILQISDPTSCYSGRQVEEISLEIPAGKKVLVLPKNADIRRGNFTYKSQWAVNGRTVNVTREFSARPSQSICLGQTRSLALEMLNDIRGDYSTGLISLVNQ